MNHIDDPADHGVPMPPGATAADRFEHGERSIQAVLRDGVCAVSVWAQQLADGTLDFTAEGGIKLWVDKPDLSGGNESIPAAQGRQVAALLVAATALGEQWTQWSTRRRRRLVVTPI